MGKAICSSAATRTSQRAAGDVSDMTQQPARADMVSQDSGTAPAGGHCKVLGRSPGEGPWMEQLAADFWTVRGSYRIAGVLDVGTQTSLVRRESGRFVPLDSYASPDAFSAIDALTEGGRSIEAIITLHPFHTLHCRAVHRHYPSAELIGTERHR